MNERINIESLGYQPLDKLPPLRRIYGVGTALYGRQVVDREANLYSKVHFFTILFIPVLYMGSFWYRLGEVAT